MEQDINLEQEPVILQAGGGAVNSVNGQTGDVVLTTADLENDSDYQTGSEVQQDIQEALGTLATVASTGDYDDLINKPTIPTAVSQLNNDSDYQTGTEVSNAIGVETTAREGADSNLQGQIDALAAASDVTDIVGTYAALQAYDTTTLKNNDIIKVLQDENQNDETTYYRWSTTTQTFTLIGEEGPYYTKSAADQKFQDKLTAGANITIDANNEISATDTTYSAGTNITITGTTISATDTTYSDFTGTDGQTAGAAGLVPAPATTDAGKFLKADGTWDTAGGGGFDPYSESRNRSDVYIPDGTNYANYFSSVYISPQDLSSANNIQNRSVNILGKASSYAQTVQIGYQASVYGADGIAIGDADAGKETVSIGQVCGNSNPQYSVFVGTKAANVGGESTMVGHGAKGSNAWAPTAIGKDAEVGTHSYAVALGAYSKNGRSEEVSVGSGTSTAPTTRLIANVTDPTLAQDAATKNYVDQAIIRSGTAAPTTSTVGSVGALYAYVESGTGHLAICTDATGGTYTWQTLV